MGKQLSPSTYISKRAFYRLTVLGVSLVLKGRVFSHRVYPNTIGIPSTLRP